MKPLFKVRQLLFRLYLNLPFSKFIFTAIRRNYLPPYRMRRWFRFHGSFTIRLSDSESIRVMNYGNTIENELFWRGTDGWEKHALAAWMNLCRQSDVIFDIGANNGLYSLISARLNPSAHIYSFEPLDMVFNRFQENLRLNDFQVNAFKVALAEEDGTGRIFAAETISDTFDQASLQAPDDASKNTISAVIVKKKLSTFIEEHNITKIDLMKIDVETYEPQVLAGMGKFLHTFRPDILIEILNDTVAANVSALIAGMNYSIYRIDEKTGYIPQADLSPKKKRGSNFLLLRDSDPAWLPSGKKRY